MLRFLSFTLTVITVAYAGKNFGGFEVMAGLVGGPGRRRTFENLQIAKNAIILAYFSKKFNKPCVNFSRVWTKTQIVGKF